MVLKNPNICISEIRVKFAIYLHDEQAIYDIIRKHFRRSDMAYQALYNKYRPQTFDEVFGQKSIVTTLKNAIREDKIAHAYLFCGPRGTGKTTMARLFSKALDCKEGLGHQCLECESCRAIAKGEHPDVIEIDAASNSTVDSVRQLIDNVSYQPIMSRYKVYIIDEVHNMSNSAFNALLKTLEEPPSFVVFILCTTEPQKIIPTILSRVQRFDFSKVTKEDLVANMRRVLDHEGIGYQEEALKAIASLSDGGVRDSLSLLDQLVSYAENKITIDDVDNLFGLLSIKDELRLVSLIEGRKTDECLRLVREKYAQGMDILRLHDDLITIFKDLAIYQATRDESLLTKLAAADCESLSMPLRILRKDIDALLSARREYRHSESLLSNLELAILALTDDSPSETATFQKVETSPAQKAEKEKAEETLASKPMEIKTEGKGFSTKAIEKKEDDQVLEYTLDDIVNLMNQADKEERISLAAKWENFSTFLSSDNAFEAKALHGAKLRLVALDVLLLTSRSLSDLETFALKKEQKAFRFLTKEVLGKEYDVLAISEAAFKEALERFKGQTEKTKKPCAIDFGKRETLSPSTEFFNELMEN